MSFGSQTFRGQPTMVYRVDAKTGEETLVRGVEMVGTRSAPSPKSSPHPIPLACLMASAVAPKAAWLQFRPLRPPCCLLKLNSSAPNMSERPPILPPPWRDDARFPRNEHDHGFHSGSIAGDSPRS